MIFDVFDVFRRFLLVFEVLEAREALQKLPGGGALQIHRISARGEPPVCKMFDFSFSTADSPDRLLNSNAFLLQNVFLTKEVTP